MKKNSNFNRLSKRRRFINVSTIQYEQGFYSQGVDADELINKLIEIKSNKIKVWDNFYYKDFLGTISTLQLTSKQLLETPLRNEIPFKVEESNGDYKTLDFKIKLNKRRGDLDTSLLPIVKVNLDQANTTYKIALNYADPRCVRVNKNVETIAPFQLNKDAFIGKNVAIELRTNDYTSFYLLLDELLPSLDVELYISQIFKNEYRGIQATDIEKRYRFYQQVPAFVLRKISDKEKVRDFRLLLSYEETNEIMGWYTEVSPVIFKALHGFNDIDYLYTELRNDTDLLESIYFDFKKGMSNENQ